MDQDATPLAATELIPPATPSVLRGIFLGNHGLRVGWSLLIFIGLIAALIFSSTLIVRRVYPPAARAPQAGSELSPAFGFIAESIPFLIVLIVTWIMSKIERRPNSVYGFGGEHKLRNFLSGLVGGVTCLSLLIIALWKTGLLVFDSRLLFGGDVLRYGVVWLFGFLLVGLLEEYLTRGYLQYTLARGLAGIYRWGFKTRHSAALGFWTAALILSILFGLGHSSNPGESPIGLLSAGLAGMVFCFGLWRTGSLWWAIGFHTSWDWAQSFLYGVADSGVMVQHHLLQTHPAGKPILSGGATGPEGSIFILAILALVSLIVLVTLPRSKDGAMADNFPTAPLTNAGA